MIHSTLKSCQAVALPIEKMGTSKMILSTLIFIATFLISGMALAQSEPCLVDYALTSSPADNAGTFEAGETVTFTFEVIEWNQTSSNWFHGAILSFGDGWDASSLTTTPAASCDAVGTWGYYDASTSIGSTFGAGFYYEANGDDDPQNNFGDNCLGGWVFEFSLTALSDCDADLSVLVNTTGDYETGGWSSVACEADVDANFTATSVCSSVPGCIDQSACNFDSLATEDDGSCEYGYEFAMTDSFGDGWNGNTYSILDCASGALLASGTLASGDSGSDFLCLEDGCYTIEVVGFSSEVAWTLFDGKGGVIISGGAPSGAAFSIGDVCSVGCTDSAASNYDSNASCDDGSCDYSIPGDDCIDALEIACGETVSGSTVGANLDDVGFCGTSTTVGGIWYTLTPDDNYLINLSTCNQANYDTKISVFTGSCDELICLGGQDDAAGCAGFSTSLDILADAGVQLFILVHGFSTAQGEFDLTITCSPACTPELSIECPGDATVECGSSIDPIDLGMAVAFGTDCTDEIIVSFSDNQISNDSCPLIIARTWTATAGDLVEMCTQIITVEDTQAPFITSFPEDFNVECGLFDEEDEMIEYLNANVPFPTAEDGCDSELAVDVQYEFIGSDECPIAGWCLKHVTFTDDCGHSVTQTLTVTLIDTEGPEFEEYENPILVSCLEEVPGPQDLMAYDDCMNSYVDVETFESNVGELTDTCNLSVAIGPGDDWALWLPILAANGDVSSANFVFDENGGQFETYNDNTAHLTGTVINDQNASESFVLDFWFENKADWATWSSMGRSYKDDLGCAQPDLYESWNYYELVNGFSSATGQGDLAGDVLYFYHMPSNYYFGFQVGQGANNKNCNYGMSGWFTYYGFAGGEYVQGNGDINVDAECGPVNEFDCIHKTEFTYLYRAEDECGNATIASQTVIVNDETGPEFIVFPADLVVDCDEYPVAIGEVEAVDNCVGDVEVSGPVDIMFPGDCPNNWTVERTWTAVDICGNITEQTQLITVIDDEAPVFEGLPENQTVQCDMVPEPADVTVSDNCSEVDAIFFDFNEEIEEGNCTGNYTIYRFWFAEDECGNEAEYTQIISVIDTTAPVFDDYEANIEMPCDAISYSVDLTASDNCGEVIVTFEDEDSDAGCAGSIIRTYTATDDCGNSATAVQTITLIDNSAPYFVSFPADDTVDCTEVPEPATNDILYGDNCTEVTLSYNGQEIIPGNCAGNYTIIRTWTITDNCDNSASDSQTINVEDNTAPEFTFIPQGGEYSCDETLPSINAEAEDDCSGATVSMNDQMYDGECENSYTIVRTFTAVDGCGNENSASITFYIYDNEAPVFTFVQADLDLECDELIPDAEATADDNCDGEVSISVSEQIIPGECPQSYTLIRTYTAVDNCENSTEATQTINVVDSTAPEFVDYEYYTYVECNEIDDYTLVAVDNCGEVTVEITEEILNSGGCMGVLWRIYVATDECGNSTEVEQYIVITDTTAPELVNVPADDTIECSDVSLGEDGLYFGAGDVYGEDNCGLDVEISYSEEVLEDGDDCPESYIIVRTWIATDYCENESMAQQTVTVLDTTDPWFLDFPANETVECSDDLPEVIWPSADDNCDEDVEIELTEETEAGDCEGEYTLMRIFRAFDNCGNDKLMVQYIYVVDTTAPEFTFVPENATYECDEEVLLVMATAEDNCSSATVSHADVDFSDVEGCPQAYSFVRVFTAIDDCGNEAVAYQNIDVVDTTAPVFDPYEVNIQMPCDMIDDAILVSATDNCGDVTITYEDDHVSGGCAGVVIRDYTAVDECGNESYAQQIINLYDEVAPEFSAFPADAEVECDNIPAVSDLVDADDNCSEEVQINYLGETILPGDCPNQYTIIRTWEAIDNCLNATEQSQTIEVDDTTAPEFEYVPSSNELSCDADLPTDEAIAFDNCGDVTVTAADVIEPGNCPNSYTVVRTHTATDECGNSATAVTEYYIYDNQAPVFTFVPGPQILECDQEPVLEDAIAEDNCGEAFVTVLEVTEDGLCDNSWSLIRIFIAVDECGNESAAQQIIFFQDTTAPEFDDYEVNISMPCDQIDDAILVSATDNCGPVTITYEDDHVSGGCAGVILRDYVAVDACGNEAYAQQIINLTDEVAPELFGVPADVSVECGDALPAIAEVGAEDNCDENLTVEYSENIIDLDCLYAIERVWTVVDHCGNEASESQIITIVDTLAPEFEGEDYTIEADCDEEVTVETPQAYDICDENVTISESVATVAGSCPNNWSEIHTFTATDDCDNSSELVVTVNYTDTQAPVFTYVPAPAFYECDEDIILEDPIAEDNCGEVFMTILPVQETLQCENSYLLTRIFIAVDACGNESAASQVITVTDTTPPTFDQEVEDQFVQCYSDAVIPTLTASDNCGSATVTPTVFEDVDECGNGIILVSYLAEDECFNFAETGFTITINDTIDPEFVGDLPQDLVIDCEAEVPAAAVLTATDNCDSDITVSFVETLEGDLPDPDAEQDCQLINPVSPYYNPDWAVWLQNMPVGLRYYTLLEGEWLSYDDGTVHITGVAESVGNPGGGWIIDLWLENELDWAAWSTQGFPTSYKCDFNDCGSEYLDWLYYIINNEATTLTGWGTFEGSLLNINHAPSNMYYGYQVGNAANNVNANYGSGGWFYYDGLFVWNGNESEISGAGDFAFDHDCCPQYQIIRTWTAEDCSGNEVSWSQTISFEDLGGEAPVAENNDDDDDNFSDHEAQKWDTPGAVFKVYPNPLANNGTVEFKMPESGKATVEIYNLSGALVMTIFNDYIVAGQTNIINFAAAELSDGIYLYKISTGGKVYTDRMIVTK
jgi:hypothetical protein